MRRERVLIFIVVVVAVTVSLAILNRNDEPSYHGRTLSEWLSIFSSHAYDRELSPEMTEAEDAIRGIGTNGIPYLLRWVRYEPPTWRDKLRRRLADSPSINDFIEGSANRKAGNSIHAFRILGTNALWAIPELTTLMNDTNSPRASKRAVRALSGLGDQGFDALASAFADPRHPNRLSIVYSFPVMAWQLGTNKCLPPLINALSHQDQLIRTSATNILLSIAPDALTNAAIQ